jgi:hypothetical protein
MMGERTFFLRSASRVSRPLSARMRARPRNSGSATRWCCAKSTKRFASVTHSSRSAMKRGFLLHFCRMRLSVHEYSEMSTGEATATAASAGPELVDVRDDGLALGDESRLESHRDASEGASPSVVGLALHTCDSRSAGGRLPYSRRKMLLKPSRARLRIVTVDAVERREKDEKTDEGLCGRGTSALICRTSRPRFIHDIGTASEVRLLLGPSAAVLIDSRGGRAASACEPFAATESRLLASLDSGGGGGGFLCRFEASGMVASFAADMGAGHWGMCRMHSAGKCESGTLFARARSSSWPSSQSSSTSRANTASWYSASSKTPSVRSSVVRALAHRISAVSCGSRGEGPTSGTVQSSRIRLRLIVLTVSNSTSDGSKYGMASVREVEGPRLAVDLRRGLLIVAVGCSMRALPSKRSKGEG